MSRSRAAGCAAALALLASTPAAAFCLPPVFEGGTRLAAIGEVRVAHLELLLRQHEICWRDTGADRRVVVTGSSVVFGHPLPAEQTWWWRADELLTTRGAAAHLFNLAFVFTYQLKDAVILEQALSHFPIDLVVHGITLSDFHHRAPMVWPEGIVKFFAVNEAGVQALRRAGAPGLEGAVSAYEAMYRQLASPPAWVLFREGGAFARVALHRLGEELRAALGGRAPEAPALTQRGAGLRRPYDCDPVRKAYAESFADWSEWNVLGYLEQVQRRGVPVLVVNWPVLHAPRDGCYNPRYPDAAYREYLGWLEAETRRRGLAYLDLHDLLPAQAFLDPLHLGPEGQEPLAQRVAGAVQAALAPPAGDAAGNRTADGATAAGVAGR